MTDSRSDKRLEPMRAAVRAALVVFPGSVVESYRYLPPDEPDQADKPAERSNE